MAGNDYTPTIDIAGEQQRVFMAYTRATSHYLAAVDRLAAVALEVARAETFRRKSEAEYQAAFAAHPAEKVQP